MLNNHHVPIVLPFASGLLGVRLCFQNVVMAALGMHLLLLMVPSVHGCGDEVFYVRYEVESRTAFDPSYVRASIEEQYQNDFDNIPLEEAFKDTIKALPEYLQEPTGRQRMDRVWNPNTNKYKFTGSVGINPRGELARKLYGGLVLQAFIESGGLGLTGEPVGETVRSQSIGTESCPSNLPKCTSEEGRCTTVECECESSQILKLTRSASGKTCWRCLPECPSFDQSCGNYDCDCKSQPNRVYTKDVVPIFGGGECYNCQRVCTTITGRCTPVEDCTCPDGMIRKETTNDNGKCWYCTDKIKVNTKSEPTPSPVRLGPNPDDEEDEDDAICFPGSSLVTTLTANDDHPESLANTTAKKRVDEIKVGDLVLSTNENGQYTFAKVIYLPHLKNRKPANYYKLTCRTNTTTTHSDNDTEKSVVTGYGKNVDQLHHVMLTARHFVVVTQGTANTGEDGSLPPIGTNAVAASMIPSHQVQVGDLLFAVVLADAATDLQTVVASNPVHESCIVTSIEVIRNNEDGVYSLYTTNGKVVVNGILVSSYAQRDYQFFDYVAGQFSHDFVHAVVGTLHAATYACGLADNSFFRKFQESVLVPLVASLVWL